MSRRMLRTNMGGSAGFERGTTGRLSGQFNPHLRVADKKTGFMQQGFALCKSRFF